jgi:flagellar biosynthesis regulator FlaF
MQALSALEDAVHTTDTDTSQELLESIELMDQASRQAGRLMNVIDDAAVSANQWTAITHCSYCY